MNGGRRNRINSVFRDNTQQAFSPFYSKILNVSSKNDYARYSKSRKQIHDLAGFDTCDKKGKIITGKNHVEESDVEYQKYNGKRSIYNKNLTLHNSKFINQAQGLGGFEYYDKKKEKKPFNFAREEESDYEDQDKLIINAKEDRESDVAKNKNRLLHHSNSNKRTKYIVGYDFCDKKGGRTPIYNSIEEESNDENFMKTYKMNNTHSSYNLKSSKSVPNLAGFDSFEKKGTRRPTYNMRDEESYDNDEESYDNDEEYFIESQNLNKNSSWNSKAHKRAQTLPGFDSYIPTRGRRSIYDARKEYYSSDEGEVYFTETTNHNKSRSAHNSKSCKRTYDLAGFRSYNKKGARKSIYNKRDKHEDEEYYMETESLNKNRSAHHFMYNKKTQDIADDHGATRKKRMDPFGCDLFAPGRISPPENPYFVTKIRKHRWDELYVPAETIKVYELDLPQFVVLRDSAGRTWDAELNKWTDGRCFYKGGWRKLCRANLIREEDLCICDFLKRTNGKFYIQVQVVR